jgi:hypothetical protein
MDSNREPHEPTPPSTYASMDWEEPFPFSTSALGVFNSELFRELDVSGVMPYLPHTGVAPPSGAAEVNINTSADR